MDTLKLAQFHNAAKDYPKAALGILNQETNVNLSIPKEPVETSKNKYSGYTYLHLAADRLDLDCTNKLLDLGADLFKQEKQNECTPLLLATRYTSCTVNIDNAVGTLSDNPVASALLSAQVNSGIALNPRDKHGISHLHAASILNHMAAMELFLNAGAAVNEAINADSPILPGYTPLHCAVRYSCKETVEVLLKFGAKIHAKEVNDKSSLHMLIEYLMHIIDMAKISILPDSSYVVEDMMDFINLAKMKNSSSDLWYAKELDKVESIIILILKIWIKTSNLGFKDDTGLSIFHVACTLRDTSMVKDLLRGNVDINSTVKSDAKLWPGWTPLHFASHFNIETVKILLQNGASINVKNAEGESPLDLCLKRYKPEDMHSVLSSTSELANILFSDNTTKLLDVILSMKDNTIFENYLQGLSDINIIIPLDSVILPGCSIVHLALSIFSGITKTDYCNDGCAWDYVEEKMLLSYKYLTSRAIEEKIYAVRIDLCLKQNCDVVLKNAAGLSPIHLAFKLGKLSAVDALLSRCDADAVSPNGFSHFHIACTMGNINLVKRLLKNGAEINQPVKSKVTCCRKLMLSDATPLDVETHPCDIVANSTALHMTMIFNNPQIAKYLVRMGADVYAEDAGKLTPMHIVLDSSKNAKSVASYILSRVEDLQDPVTSVGLSYLHVAASVNDEEIIGRSLRRGSNVNAHFNPPLIIDPSIPNHSSWFEDFAYKTPLHVAVMMNSPEAVRALIAGGADIHRKNLGAPTPLQFALSTAKRDYCLRHFVDKLKSDERRVGAVDDSGLTLLHVACAEFDFQWAGNLLRNGADPNARTGDGKWKGKAPLHVLISEARTRCKSSETLKRMVDLLLKFGADVTLGSDDASTPLHLAYNAVYNKADKEEEKEQSDSEPEDMDVDNQEATSYVNEENLLSIVDILLKSQNSYDVNPVDSNGLTHFHIACARNDVEVARNFLDQGVDVNQATDPFAKQNKGFAPLHFGFANKCNDIIYLLIKSGADVQMQDAFGNALLHIAMSNHFVDLQLIEVLLRLGVDINQQNLRGELPFELFLKTNGFNLNQLEFFLKHQTSISSVYTAKFEGIIGLAMKNCQSNDFQSIFTRLIEACGTSHAIHSAVSIFHRGKLTHDNYVEIIEKLTEAGCDLDERDERGMTAFHSALLSINIEAASALLMLGANPNIPICPRNCDFPTTLIITDSPNESIERIRHIGKFTTTVALKMKFVGLDVSNIVMVSNERMGSRYPLDENLEKRWSDELSKLQDIKVNELFTMKDLLSECLMVVRYPTMLQGSRQVMDEFFKNKQNMRKEFPALCGLLTMQYRKALARDELFESAKNAINFLYNVHFPDSCLDFIFAYFENDDLESMILAIDP